MKFQVAKIVGTASEKSWSQTHVFRPSAEEANGSEKLTSYGELLAALEFKVSGEDISVSAFGKEIIQRLQEIYFANESEGILRKVSQTMETLAAEFAPQIDLSIVMLVIWENQGNHFAYAGRQGGGQIYLKRGEKTVPLFSGDSEAVAVVSGQLMANDQLLLGTQQFFKIIPEGVVTSAMAQSEVNDSLENLAAVVHGHEDNSRAAGIVAKLTEDQALEAPPNPIPNSVPSPSSSTSSSTSLRLEWLRAKIDQLLRGRSIRLGQGSSRQKKSAATIALILILVFATSLVLAGRKRQQTKQETEITNLLESVEYQVNEARGLLTLNPLRAKFLIQEAKLSLEEYRKNHDGKLPEKLEKLALEIDSLLGATQREYDAAATEWFSFDLVSEGFKATDWEVDENTLWAFDSVRQEVVSLDLSAKSSDILIQGEEVAGGNLIGLTGNRGFVVTNNKVIVIDQDGEVVAEVAADEWGEIADSVGFGGNLYLLDSTENGQIWKYTGVDAGLGSKQAYIDGTNLDLSSAVSLAIDGSVWMLFDDGTILKYVRGDKDSFVVTGLDEPLAEPVRIYTSPEVDNLYILDRAKTRVVVIGKSGEYQAQYGWSGIAGAIDLVVSEEQGKIYLLTGEKIFAIDLQN
jgi:hypothetical protein